MNIPACPPIPNLTDLNNPNKYMLINPIDVVLDEFLVMRHGENISCIKIVYVFSIIIILITKFCNNIFLPFDSKILYQ